MNSTNNIPTGYKHSAFGNIPEDWEVVELGQIAKIKRGRFSPRPRNDPKFYGGKIPFVQTSDISLSDGRVSTFNQTLNEEGLKVSVLFPKGTILITIAANIGHSAILDIDMACPDSLVGIICHESIYNEYLNYFLRYIQKRLEYIAPGAQKNINVEFLSPLPVLKPPIAEQLKIAAFLGKFDALINNMLELKISIERRKRWLFQQLLTGRKRLAGFHEPWTECHLGDMFAERIETFNFDLPLLSIGANGVYPQTDSSKRDTSNEDKSKYRRICKGDIGYNTMRMWQGRSALSNLDGIVSPAYTIVTPKDNADPLFFSYLFKTPRMLNLFWRNSQGLVEDTLNCKFKDFSKIKIMLPGKEEQQSIARILEVSGKEVDLLDKKIQRLKEQKKGIMQLLLTGKKRL